MEENRANVLYKEAFINGCKIQTPAGTIEITNDVIATVAELRQIFTELSEWQAKIKLKIT